VYIKEIAFLKDSIPSIELKNKIESKIQEMFNRKKQITKDLPAIIKE
jgi:hypothetical protein